MAFEFLIFVPYKTYKMHYCYLEDGPAPKLSEQLAIWRKVSKWHILRSTTRLAIMPMATGMGFIEDKQLPNI